jgi:hypothetical protein
MGNNNSKPGTDCSSCLMALPAIAKQPFSELVGGFILTWIRKLLMGLLLGAVLMLLPAFSYQYLALFNGR